VIPAVIFNPPAQRVQVARLVDWCRELDGTELLVIEPDGSSEPPYPRCTDWAFRQVLNRMDGDPFVYLEADSIPLKAGWLNTLLRAWSRSDSEILLPADNGSPDDRISGIGVYGEDASWLIPDPVPTEGHWYGAWDGWLIEHVPHLVTRTTLIQHSYGWYKHGVVVHGHTFPRDSILLRPEAVLFHKNADQTLIDYVRDKQSRKAA
jgi:hypothetical protein